MRYLIVFLIISIKINCKAQDFPDSAIAVFSKEKSISKLFSNSFILNNKVLKGSFIGTTQNIDFGVTHYFDVWSKDFGNGKYPAYWISLYAKDDTIFYVDLLKMKYENNGYQISNSFFSKVSDSSILVKFISQHNDKYYSSWKLADFYNQASKWSWSFTFSSNNANKPDNDEYDIPKLVKDKNLNRLKALASSFCVPDRVNGTIGLSFLILMGEKLQEDLINLIAVNKHSKIEVYQYFQDYSTDESMESILDSREINSYYNIYMNK